MRKAGWIAGSIALAALLVLIAWLASNRIFLDPTDLRKEDALVVQAAWAQAILSAFAVIAAMLVGQRQSRVNLEIADASHRRSMDLVNEELKRANKAIGQESAARRVLARHALRPLVIQLKLGVKSVALGPQENVEGKLLDIISAASTAKTSFEEIRKHLETDAKRALMCRRIAEVLGECGTLWDDWTAYSRGPYSPQAGGFLPRKIKPEEYDILQAKLVRYAGSISRRISLL
ncbi:hypothetical protein PV767_03965 [Stenotrophomonas rhizophila]|uniref:hypothetical protein n=1 Tax=Stenotrophomonas TaxID=40323 RepID=UPI003B7EF4B2